MAQITRPTMEIPIQYALTYPNHEYCGGGKFPFDKDIRFLAPDEKNFPMPVYAKSALKMGGNMPAKINSANEAGVELFLSEKIRFTDIMRLVEHTLNNETAEKYNDYLDVIETHKYIYDKIMRDYPRILEN
jgi:1-deoxy-D-xylulose-5-phosphate reductoisomerase